MGYRKYKLSRMAEDPFCWYCGCEVIDYTPSEGGRMPPYAATIEHLNSRRHGPRVNKVGIRVLACYRCNNDRSKWTTILGRNVRREDESLSWLAQRYATSRV